MTTTTPKPPRPMKLNRTKADLVPAERFAEWYRIASATAGLSELDRQILDVIVEYYRQLAQRGYASFPSIEQMAKSSGARPIDISGAIKRLVGLALLAVRPGSGRWRNEYLPALPRKLAATLGAPAADDVPAPPF
jgi:hypothetical protein